MYHKDITLLAVSRCTVQVPCHLEQDCLGEGRLVVDPGAPLPVGAGARLEEEGAVNLGGGGDGHHGFGRSSCL